MRPATPSPRCCGTPVNHQTSHRAPSRSPSRASSHRLSHIPLRLSFLLFRPPSRGVAGGRPALLFVLLMFGVPVVKSSFLTCGAAAAVQCSYKWFRGAWAASVALLRSWASFAAVSLVGAGARGAQPIFVFSEMRFAQFMRTLAAGRLGKIDKCNQPHPPSFLSCAVCSRQG